MLTTISFYSLNSPDGAAYHIDLYYYSYIPTRLLVDHYGLSLDILDVE